MAVAERELLTFIQEPAENITPLPFHWTINQFHEIGESGLFEDQRVILIEGKILAMPPIKPPHQGMTTIVGEIMRTAFGDGFVVREQGPFKIGTKTDPQPDIAVVVGSVRDFLLAHPTKSALILEVSDTTLAYDRREKASLYAKAGIQDYWIVNINGAQVEVYRQPQPDETQPYGYGYMDVKFYQAGEIIQPLASSNPVAVSALLP